MADRYWVGGTGNWNDTNRWSATSGGPTGASVPTASDNAMFDANSGNGTCTTTTGATCLSLTINDPDITLFLGADMTVVGATTLTTGIFDADGKNFTTSTFSSTNSNVRTIRMGSGVWSIAGTGTVWNTNSLNNLTFIGGTAEVILTDNSTATRTFSAGVLSGAAPVFYKLTIGGNTSTSITNISGGQYNELASTKTVAHTVQFTAGSFTAIGKWSITGTAGNPVTVKSNTNGTITVLYLIGSRVSDVDYLSVRDITVQSYIVSGNQISGAEFYAGANSTNVSNNTRVIFTAAPASRTLYWVGGTGNWGDTARWSLTSGGTGGEAVPTSADNVIFNSSSSTSNAAYTVTVNVAGACNQLTMNGPGAGNKVTFAGAQPLFVHESFSLAGGTAEITFTFSSTILFGGSTSGKTINTNGVTIPGFMQVYGIGSTWSLSSALIQGVNGGFTVRNGTFNTNNYNLTTRSFATLYTGYYIPLRATNLGSSTVTTLVSAGTLAINNLNNTFNAGTSTIIAGSGASSPTIIIDNVTLYNLSISGDSFTTTITGSNNTFNNVSFNARTTTGRSIVTFNGNQTINGVLTLYNTNNPIRRLMVASETPGTQITITVNGTIATTSDTDFRDINLSTPLSGTRLGDCGNNTNITFDTPKTVYWNLAGSQNWSATAWATTNNGTPAANNFPLAQDIAVFTEAGSAGTITTDAAWNIGTLTFNDGISPRTSAVSLSTGSISPTFYGNVKLTSAVTLTGTGTLIFSGQSNQVITSALRAFTQGILINASNGRVFLDGDLTVASCNLTAGVLNLKGSTLNAGASFTTATGTKTLALSGGRLVISGSGATAFNNAAPANFTVIGDGVIAMTATSSATFVGGNTNFSCDLEIGGTGPIIVTGSNSFNALTNSIQPCTLTLTAGTTQTISRFGMVGTSGNLVTIDTTGAVATLSKAYGTTVGSYLSLTNITATGGATWYTGVGSSATTSTGWTVGNGVSSRLTNTGVLSTAGLFDEVTYGNVRLQPNATYGSEFDEVTINGASGGLARSITTTGSIRVSGSFDETSSM